MASWKNRPVRRGLTWCGDCSKWKAHKAFVRSRVKRDSKEWVREGYIWKKYNTCNRCARIYHHRPMSIPKFLEVFGAEEHNDSEIEWDDDEVPGFLMEEIKIPDVETDEVKTEDVKVEEVEIEESETEESETKGDKAVVKIEVVKTEGDKTIIKIKKVETEGGEEETAAPATT